MVLVYHLGLLGSLNSRLCPTPDVIRFQAKDKEPVSDSNTEVNGQFWLCHLACPSKPIGLHVLLIVFPKNSGNYLFSTPQCLLPASWLLTWRTAKAPLLNPSNYSKLCIDYLLYAGHLIKGRETAMNKMDRLSIPIQITMVGRPKQHANHHTTWYITTIYERYNEVRVQWKEISNSLEGQARLFWRPNNKAEASIISWDQCWVEGRHH